MMALFPETLSEIDFWDLDMFTDGDPHLAWSILRRDAPVWFHDREGGEPFWCVTRYEDVHAVLADPVHFSSRDGIAVGGEPSTETPLRLRVTLVTDPPRHAPLRKVMSHDFTPRAIARLEAQLRGIVGGYLDEVADQRDVDFVTAVAHPIPAAIALSLLGAPKADWPRLAELEHITIAVSDPEFVPEGSDRDVVVSEAQQELHAYFRALTEERRINPRDDLISQLLNGVVQDEPLTPKYVAFEAQLLMTGGLDTTRAAASAGGMLPLLERVDEMARLRSNPEVLTTAVNEFVRWGSPLTHLARTVTGPTVIGDVALNEGERVVVFLPSANRDDDQFPEPFRYDLARRPNRHIGFGFAEHYCLGVHLARLTLKVMFEQIAGRFKTIDLTGEPARVRSNFVGGLKHLPVHMEPV